MADLDFTVTPEKGDVKNKKSIKNDKTSHDHGDGLDINLMPSELRQRVEKIVSSVPQYLVKTLSAALIVSALLFAIVWGYGFFMRQQLRGVMAQIDTVNKEIASIEKGRGSLLSFQSKLSDAKKLLESHIYWSKFLDGLEKNTIPEVTYLTVTTTADETVNLNAFAKDFSSVGKQVLVFQESPDFASSVNASAAHAVLGNDGKSEGVTFTLSLKLNPSLLKKNSNE